MDQLLPGSSCQGLAGPPRRPPGGQFTGYEPAVGVDREMKIIGGNEFLTMSVRTQACRGMVRLKISNPLTGRFREPLSTRSLISTGLVSSGAPAAED